MKTVKQLLRQPLKTVIGITLMTLAAAIVCLCVGQALAAQSTKEELNRRFSTVGIPLVQEDLDGVVTKNSYFIDEEFLAWLDEMAAEHPDIVKQVARHGILSANIPELTPLNFTAGNGTNGSGLPYSLQPIPRMMPYNCAMLVITLEEVSEPKVTNSTWPVENLHREDFDTYSDYIEWLYVNPETEKMTAPTGYRIELTGTVTQVVSLADGYRNPVGRIARLTFYAPTLEEAETLELVPGERYIVYGMDYVDAHWEFVSRKNVNGKYDHLDLENYNPEKFRFLTEQERKKYQAYADMNPKQDYMRDWIAVYDGIFLNETEYKELNAISLTLELPVSFVKYEEIRDEQTGRLLELVPKTDVSYTDKNGETVTVNIDEYNRRYAIPTIEKLSGSAADFLQSDGAAAWKDALQTAQINNRAFAVIGVDRMDYLADFSLRRSYITQGRRFTEEEHSGDSRVCIIHESVAEASGLKVGDTVTLNLYNTDYGLPYQSTRADGFGLLNPSASYYFSTTPITETAEYTIVGLWGGWTLWPDVGDDPYDFSPNTVFVPKSSVQTEMEYCNSVLFVTVVPQNGKLDAFHELALSSGNAGRLKYNDQDYGTIAANFHNYEALAKQMLTVGVVIYTVLLLLFLLLYPGAKKGSAKTMQSLGAGFFRRFGHVVASSLGIVIPASVLGGWIGTLLWDGLVAALQTTAESAVALQLETGALVQISAVQLIFAMILTVCVALFVAAPTRLSARR